jgi:hypothetical protein
MPPLLYIQLSRQKSLWILSDISTSDIISIHFSFCENYYENLYHNIFSWCEAIFFYPKLLLIFAFFFIFLGYVDFVNYNNFKSIIALNLEEKKNKKLNRNHFPIILNFFVVVYNSPLFLASNVRVCLTVGLYRVANIHCLFLVI